MSAALSPTSVATNSEDNGPITSKDFAKYVNYYQQTHKAIVRLTSLVYRLPASQPFTIGNHSIRRSDVSNYSRAYVSQLGDLRKMFNAKRRKRGGSGGQLAKPFYVSDQLVSFYKKANLGPLDPSSPKSGKLADAIKILTEEHMSTSGILTSLISRYIEVNGLKTKESSGRFMPDDRMRTAFKTTKYVLRGKDLSKRSIPDGTPDEKVKRIKESIKEGSKSAFERVSDRVDRRTGKPVYDEDTGLLYTTMMVFNNFYRIPPQLLTSEEKEALEDEENIQSSKDLQDRLSKITAWSHSQK